MLFFLFVNNLYNFRKNHLFVDRRIYCYKGSWRDKKQDLDRVCYYFISSPLSLQDSFESGRETLKPTMEITVFGEFPFCEHDKFVLQDGSSMLIGNITYNYFEKIIFNKLI